MSIELSTRGTVSEIYLLIMWNVLTVTLLVTLPAFPAVTLTEAALPNGDMQEFCSSAWEVFQAKCQPDEVILITDAVFGRWKESRCNPAGYEVVDCSENVRALAEVRCSGKQSCEIPLPDKMFEKTAPCREDLKSNLKIGYQCIKIILPTKNQCLISSDIDDGYLASVVSASTSCGLPLNPWIIDRRAGERISMSIMDFTGISFNISSTHCQVLAIIKDKQSGRSQTVCSGNRRPSSSVEEREKHVFLSDTNHVEIRFIGGKSNSEGQFLMRFEAHGCVDLNPPKGGWWQRAGNNATFGCAKGSRIWRVTCKGNKWVGDQGNCSEEDPSLLGTSMMTSFAKSQFVAITVILCIALIVGVFIFLLGYCVIKQRQLEQESLQAERQSKKFLGIVPDQGYSLSTKSDGHQFLEHDPRKYTSESDDNEYAYVDELQFPSKPIQPHPGCTPANAYGLLQMARQTEIDPEDLMSNSGISSQEYGLAIDPNQRTAFPVSAASNELPFNYAHQYFRADADSQFTNMSA